MNEPSWFWYGHVLLSYIEVVACVYVAIHRQLLQHSRTGEVELVQRFYASLYLSGVIGAVTAVTLTLATLLRFGGLHLNRFDALVTLACAAWIGFFGSLPITSVAIPNAQQLRRAAGEE